MHFHVLIQVEAIFICVLSCYIFCCISCYETLPIIRPWIFMQGNWPTCCSSCENEQWKEYQRLPVNWHNRAVVLWIRNLSQEVLLIRLLYNCTYTLRILGVLVCPVAGIIWTWTQVKSEKNISHVKSGIPMTITIMWNQRYPSLIEVLWNWDITTIRCMPSGRKNISLSFWWSFSPEHGSVSFNQQ